MTDRSEFEHLATAVEGAMAGLAADREALAAERAASEHRIAASVRKMRAYRFAGIIGAIAATVALVVGVIALQAIEEMRTQRAHSRIVTCQKDNETAAKINALGGAFRQVITFATPANPSRTPEQQARVDEFVAQANHAIDGAKVSSRDCSPHGIAVYYSTTTTTAP